MNRGKQVGVRVWLKVAYRETVGIRNQTHNLFDNKTIFLHCMAGRLMKMLIAISILASNDQRINIIDFYLFFAI